MAESTNGSGPAEPKVEQTARPTRPDEAAFNKNLVDAEKAHKASMEKLVCFCHLKY